MYARRRRRNFDYVGLSDVAVFLRAGGTDEHVLTLDDSWMPPTLAASAECGA